MSFAVLDDIALAAPRRYQPRARRPCRPTFVNCNPVVLICHVSRLHYASSDPPAPINKVIEGASRAKEDEDTTSDSGRAD
ncbi:hypothetical protein B0H11DRAFT_2242882 [Mycena galericulata]|nr:hypothetical protein B0H11DRAFT_2242882 [Mycena galericulata]